MTEKTLFDTEQQSRKDKVLTVFFCRLVAGDGQVNQYSRLYGVKTNNINILLIFWRKICQDTG